MGSLKVNVVVNEPEILVWNFSLELKVNSKKDVDIYNSNLNPLAIFCELFKDKLDKNNQNIKNVQEKEKSDAITKEFIYNIIGIANTKENERSNNVDILAFKVKRQNTSGSSITSGSSTTSVSENYSIWPRILQI